jgi:hypothetical protein
MRMLTLLMKLATGQDILLYDNDEWIQTLLYMWTGKAESPAGPATGTRPGPGQKV